MTPEQQQGIGDRWAKIRSTTDRLRRAAEAFKDASLANAPAERLRDLSNQYDEAQQADNIAHDELEAALRSIGINV